MYRDCKRVLVGTSANSDPYRGRTTGVLIDVGPPTPAAHVEELALRTVGEHAGGVEGHPLKVGLALELLVLRVRHAPHSRGLLPG